MLCCPVFVYVFSSCSFLLFHFPALLHSLHTATPFNEQSTKIMAEKQGAGYREHGFSIISRPYFAMRGTGFGATGSELLGWLVSRLHGTTVHQIRLKVREVS